MNLKQLTFVSSIVILSFLLTGCNQYEVSKDSQGRTIRLNKSTGEITVIEGGKLIVPKTEEQVKAEAQANKIEETLAKASTKKLSDRRSWPVIQGVLGTKATCSTIYMNSALRYRIEFGKIPRGFTGAYGQSFDIEFLKSGIKVYEDRAKSNTIVDSDGKPITTELSGSIIMSEEDYESLDGVTMGWNGLN